MRFLSIILFLCASCSTFAQTQPETLRFNGEEIVRLSATVGVFTPNERINRAGKMFYKVANDYSVSPQELFLAKNESGTLIMAGEIPLVGVTIADALSASLSENLLSQQALSQSIKAITAYRKVREGNYIFWGVVKTFGIFFFAYVFFYLLKKLFSRLERRVRLLQSKTQIRFLQIHNKEGFSYDKLWEMLATVLRITHLLFVLAFLYFTLPFALTFFPWTAPYSKKVISLMTDPFVHVLQSFANYLPSLFLIIVIILFTRWLLWGVKKVFTAIEEGHISLQGFHPDWANPTYRLVSILIWIFSFAIIFPYLPGSKSPAFQGISVIAGLLFTFSSGPAIGNMVAGLVIIYMRPFKVGDRVKMGDVVGDVIEKTILVTRIRTIKNEEITVPNSSVLAGQIVNYSSVGKLVLHTSVTIGYDAPWRQVHELLIQAALATPMILQEPKPFVLQTSLDDFYVCYELNAHTDKPREMAQIYSDLHSHIQDSFNKAGVEIMSPHYRAMRSGEEITIPKR